VKGAAVIPNGQPFVVIGGGGSGREVLDVLEAINEVEWTFDILGVVDDDPSVQEILSPRGIPFLGSLSSCTVNECAYAIGVSDPRTRAQIADLAGSKGWLAQSLIHPTATEAFDVTIGEGTVIAAGARLMNHIVLGRHVHVSLNSTVGHDAILGDFVTIYPGVNISGNVILEEGVSMGTGSAVVQGVTIGRYAVLGAGAVVVRSLEQGRTYVGVPAKPLPDRGKQA